MGSTDHTTRRTLPQGWRFGLNGWTPDLRGPNGRGLCRYCGKEVEGRRQTFCSDGCVSEWRVRRDPAYMRRAVFERDRGVCAVCETDTEAIRRLFHYRGDRTDSAFTAYNQLLYQYGIPPGRQRRVQRWRYWEYTVRALWEADHILPVVEGGGACGLDNLRTLCLGCHRTVTAALAAKRARERRAQKDD